MSEPEEFTVTFKLAFDDSPFSIPEIGVLMPGAVTYRDGWWFAESFYDENDAKWHAEGETRVGAILALLKARCGER